MGRPLLVLLVLALALVPAAEGHFEGITQGTSFRVGPYYAYLEPRPPPIHANASVGLAASLARAADSIRVTDADVRVLLQGPHGEEINLTLVSDGRDYVAPVRFPSHGAWRAILEVTGDNGTHAGNATFDVYQDLAYRIRPVDLNTVIDAGRTTPLVFETVDPVTYARVDAVEDLRLRIEEWTYDHKEMLSAEEKDMQGTAPGVWRVDHVFPREGMYHLRFASTSGGFSWDDVPYFHADPLDPVDDRGATTPFPALPALVALLVVTALLGRRR